MNKIITQCIYRKQGNPDQVKKLEQERDNFKKDLNSILNEWNWRGKSITTSKEFLNKFKPWIKARNEEIETLTKFLKKHKITSLADIKEVKIKGG